MGGQDCSTTVTTFLRGSDDCENHGLRSVDHLVLTPRLLTADTLSESLRGLEFEQWVALRFVEVILGRVIDTNPVSAKKADGWPHARAEQPAQEKRLVVG